MIKRILYLAFAASALQALRAQTATVSPAQPTDHKVPIHLVVFSDFECPFSATMFQTLHVLQTRYGDRMHIVLKQSPLSIHPGAALAHQAALAAGRQGKFDPMAALLYANESQHSRSELLSYASYLHLDMQRFTGDLEAPEIVAEVVRDQNEAEAMGVDATPTIFLEGRKLVGIQSTDRLRTIIDAANPLAANSSFAGATSTPALDANTAQTMSAGGQARGTQSAPLTLVEFTDFQCPFCAAATEPLRALREARGRDVKVVYRAFPLDFHANANLAAEAAFAAGAQGRFWEMHDLLFANQHALAADDLDRYAQQLGLNMTAFREALSTHRFAAQVAEDRALGLRAGVTGTPTFFLNGEETDGVRSLPELTAWIDKQMASPAAASPAAVALQPSAPAELTISGSKSAKLTISWYTDVRSASASSQAALIRALIAHGKEKLRVLVMPFPSSSREDSMVAANALLQAQKTGKFWEMYDQLADRRDVLTAEKVTSIASGLGFDAAGFRQSLDEEQPELVSRLEEASRRGILGAPVLFINGERVDGLQREGFYLEILDRQMGGSGSAASGLR